MVICDVMRRFESRMLVAWQRVPAVQKEIYTSDSSKVMRAA